MQIFEGKENCPPVDWPANTYEQRLSLLIDLFDEFLDKPSYLTRERLVAAATSSDLNDNKFKGTVRFTKYEVCLINTLYLFAIRSNVGSVINYLYLVVMRKTRIFNMSLHTAVELKDDKKFIEQINLYKEGLYPSLKLFHLIYEIFNIEKCSSFYDQTVRIVKGYLEECNDSKFISNLTFSYSQMLKDFSTMHGLESLKILEFNREELYNLFEFEAKLFKLNNQKVSESPTRGMLMMQISNLILKSRNGYNQDYICKYISKENSIKAIENIQLWMSDISNLNDKNEQWSFLKFLESEKHDEFKWANNISYDYDPNYYLSSYSKSINNSYMKEKYGDQIFGYKSDRILDYIGPICFLVNKESNNSVPALFNTVAFDIIYDKHKLKEEINYLKTVINLFDLTSEQKRSFYKEILQYWLLSYKDKKWEREKERRYVTLIDKHLKMIETDIDDDYLKIKTSLYKFPDFIIGGTPAKKIIKHELECKRDKLFSGDYYYCKDCLMQDHDILDKNLNKCLICGSSNIVKITK